MTTTTPDPSGPKKRPPMVKAIRDFIAAMEFPPQPKHGPNPNITLAGVVLAALSCCNIEADAQAVEGSFALQQVADILHCSTRHVERVMRDLKEFGTLTTERRGNLSSLYTFYRSRAIRQQLSEQSDPTTVVATTDSAVPTTQPRVPTTPAPCADNSEPCADNSPPVCRQQLSYSGSSLDTSLEKNSLARLWANDPAVAGSTVGSQESQEGCRPDQPGPPSTGLIVKREGSGVPPKEICGICKTLNQPSGDIVFRRGTELFCQHHNTPIFTGRDR